MEEKFIADLKGFSGCKLKLLSGDGCYFVRKISKSADYNARLERQMNKQSYFVKNLATDNIASPKILRSGYIGDCFYFDMEYVNGINLAMHIAVSDINELINVSQALCDILKMMKNAKNNVPAELFSKSKKKVCELHSKLASSSVEIVSVLNQLTQLADGFSDDNAVSETFCHGDLTMENILYDSQNRKFYLIDFLDNYADHYWFDIAKLFQDIEGRWYEFRYPELHSSEMNVNMGFIANFLKKFLLEQESSYLGCHYYLLALTFARIIPYAQENDFAYLIETINRLAAKQKSGEYYV